MAINSITLNMQTKSDEEGIRVILSITKKQGDIDPHIILVNINDAEPDSFNRICSLSDIPFFPVSRADAVIREVSQYRTNYFSIIYDTYEEALEARRSLKDAVNAYVAEFNSFNGVINPVTNSLEHDITGMDLTLLEELELEWKSLSQQAKELETESNNQQFYIDALTQNLQDFRARVEANEKALETSTIQIENIIQNSINNLNTIAAYGVLTPTEVSAVNAMLAARQAERADLKDVYMKTLYQNRDQTRNFLSAMLVELQDAVRKQAAIMEQFQEAQRAADRVLAKIREISPEFDNTTI